MSDLAPRVESLERDVSALSDRVATVERVASEARDAALRTEVVVDGMESAIGRMESAMLSTDKIRADVVSLARLTVERVTEPDLWRALSRFVGAFLFVAGLVAVGAYGLTASYRDGGFTVGGATVEPSADNAASDTDPLE